MENNLIEKFELQGKNRTIFGFIRKFFDFRKVLKIPRDIFNVNIY